MRFQLAATRRPGNHHARPMVERVEDRALLATVFSPFGVLSANQLTLLQSQLPPAALNALSNNLRVNLFQGLNQNSLGAAGNFSGLSTPTLNNLGILANRPFLGNILGTRITSFPGSGTSINFPGGSITSPGGLGTGNMNAALLAALGGNSSIGRFNNAALLGLNNSNNAAIFTNGSLANRPFLASLLANGSLTGNTSPFGSLLGNGSLTGNNLGLGPLFTNGNLIGNGNLARLLAANGALGGAGFNTTGVNFPGGSVFSNLGGGSLTNFPGGSVLSVPGGGTLVNFPGGSLLI